MLSLEVKDCEITDESLQFLEKKAQHLQILNLDSCAKLTKIGIFSMLSNSAFVSTSLSTLNLAGLGFIDTNLQKVIAKRCTKLQNLNLSSSFLEDGILDIANHCKGLKVLNISGCSGVTDDLIERIRSISNSLAKLNITNIKTIDMRYWTNKSGERSVKIITSISNSNKS